MTETEWQECADPRPLLRWLHGPGGERKLRLFGCHCCRRVWDLLGAERRRIVRASERYADGRISAKAWRRLGTRLAAARTAADEAAWAAWKGYGVAAAWRAAEAAEDAAPPPAKLATWQGERAGQAALLRELCGSPFRPRRSLDPAVLRWDDKIVIRIAEDVYRQGAFGRLPLLADALLDAGCDDEDLLAHCRGDEPHVRGCWALDTILGKF